MHSSRIGFSLTALTACLALAACGGKSFRNSGSHDAGVAGAAGTGGGSGTGGSGATAGTGGGGGSGTGGSGGGGGSGGQMFGPNCGAPGQPCCLGNSCRSGGCCIEETCVADGQSCGSSYGTCHQGSCGTCGGAGQKCCAEKKAEGCSSTGPNCGGCTQLGTSCPNYDVGGTCTPCGGDGQPCCGVSGCLGEFSLCISGTCSSLCGQPGQPCCQGVQRGEQPWPPTCRNGGCCISTSAGRTVCLGGSSCGCSNGTCTTCGVLGMPCCNGQCQLDQGTCMNGMCGNSPPPGGP